MDIITPAEPPLIRAGLPAEPTALAVVSSNVATTPLELIEAPKARTKLRLYAILFGLYVTNLPGNGLKLILLANDTL